LIVDADHHQLVIQILTTMYDYASLFSGKYRKQLWEDFILGDQFESLFCHWDLIVFKTTRSKRKYMKERELDINSPRGSRTTLSDDYLDFELLQKLEEQIRKIEGKVTGINLKEFYDRKFLDSHLLYCVNSLEEYKRYEDKYRSWEEKNIELPPLQPLVVVKSKG
ncbi:hypothetical protein PROFUN_16670, partial [Planoprotostelium fungivorum]